VSAARRAIAARPITWFVVIGIGVYFVAVAIPPLVREFSRFDLPVDGVIGGILGVGIAAFLVTAAADGRAGVDDLVARILRWRVPVRYYVFALFSVPLATVLLALALYRGDALDTAAGGWAKLVGEVGLLFVLQFFLFQLAEEVGWTGFFQHGLRDRYRPIKLSAVVAVFWAAWHVPDHFAREGWGLESIVSAPFLFLFELVVLFFARVVIVWLYEATGLSVLLVVIWHASVDATYSRLSEEVIPASDAVTFLLVTLVIVVPAVAVIVSWRLRRGEPAPTQSAASIR
jgi:membrane protease YdiL (CAAX protease family)